MLGAELGILGREKSILVILGEGTGNSPAYGGGNWADWEGTG